MTKVSMYCAPEPEPACEDDGDCGGAGVCDLESGTCGGDLDTCVVG